MSGPVQNDALSLAISLEAVPAEQIVEGHPQTGFRELGSLGSVHWGVWEMTPGAMSDVEVEETFVVIQGEGVVHRQIEGHEEIVNLAPGVVVSLTAGEHTVWRVSQTLRKVYFSPAE